MSANSNLQKTFLEHLVIVERGFARLFPRLSACVPFGVELEWDLAWQGDKFWVDTSRAGNPQHQSRSLICDCSSDLQRKASCLVLPLYAQLSVLKAKTPAFQVAIENLAPVMRAIAVDITPAKKDL